MDGLIVEISYFWIKKLFPDKVAALDLIPLVLFDVGLERGVMSVVGLIFIKRKG